MTETATRPEFLTVRELSELLRIKERKVYDLAASGEIPCSRATGKLLFPEAEVRAWIGQSLSGTAPRAERSAIIIGSQDPLLDWALRQSQAGLPMHFGGSLDGLSRFADGEGIAAGLHIHDGASGEWNVPLVRARCAGQDAVLIGWAARMRGLVLARESSDIRSFADLKGRRLVARQKESGADLLLSDMLGTAGLVAGEVNFTDPVRSEDDAVLTVAQGEADLAFGLHALAAQYGLGFVPVIEERFDLLVDRRAYFEPPFQNLMRFAQSDTFVARAKGMAGYDVSDLGQVRWNA